MAILNRLMRRVLANVDVLGPFSATNEVAPFDACVVILVYFVGA
jgi:hypothetical protein